MHKSSTHRNSMGKDNMIVNNVQDNVVKTTENTNKKKRENKSKNIDMS